eukprot:CAMPEP_0176056016 /NCGR_PEP_ID=MMETSP0120_2-20121206/27892_1 /TAXON_ID=160619 /ORGANISM="Kryptoperidinium foliaceum, Strain CCMP 1326" /LENGTH=346 /DNA_ID=CAMNT_0017389517 /DNA_START=59 /DNA_END=1099 /DNA_ORIENTATION=+
MARADLYATCRKQSWADLSDDEDEHPQMSVKRGMSLDGMSATTCPSSPLTPWVDGDEDLSDISDLDSKCHGLGDAAASLTAGKSEIRGCGFDGDAGKSSCGGNSVHNQVRTRKQNSAVSHERNSPLSQSPSQSRTMAKHRAKLACMSPDSAWAEADIPPSPVVPSPVVGVQPFSVQVDGMPTQLCNDCCLDAILHQAGLQDYVLGYDVAQGSKGGIATIRLANWQAATQCFSHFSKQSWNMGKAVKVRMAPTSKVNAQTQQHTQGPQRSQRPPQPALQPRQQQQLMSQHPMTMGCGVFLPQAGVHNAECHYPLMAWIPATYAAEAGEFIPQPFFDGQPMLMAGVQM